MADTMICSQIDKAILQDISIWIIFMSPKPTVHARSNPERRNAKKTAGGIVEDNRDLSMAGQDKIARIKILR